MRTALTIAGSDPSGGAGIQADIKTMTCNGVYAMSAITALTAQNTLGVTGILETPPEFLGSQLDAVFTDIFPDAVKIGMVSSEHLIDVIATKLIQYHAVHIVIDPVMISTSGTRLLEDSAMTALTEKLFPLADLLTPNIPEAEMLAGMQINTSQDMITAAEKISRSYNCAVLCKGGHSKGSADDLLYQYGEYRWYKAARIDNPNTHGTGCTLSSAIASNLAKGCCIAEAVQYAKDYITAALRAELNLGKGNGPLRHDVSFDKSHAKDVRITQKPEEAAYFAENHIPYVVWLNDSNRGETFPSGAYCVENPSDTDEGYLDRIFRRFMGMPWQITETQRLRIREITVDDVPRLYQLYDDESITRYMEPLFPDPAQELEYTKEYIRNVYGFYGYGMWIIEEKESGRVIGRAGLESKEGFEGLELGFMLGVDYQHKGYAYEACSAILKYGIEELGINRYCAFVNKDNTASAGLCERLGFCVNGIERRNEMNFDQVMVEKEFVQYVYVHSEQKVQ